MKHFFIDFSSPPATDHKIMLIFPCQSLPLPAAYSSALQVDKTQSVTHSLLSLFHVDRTRLMELHFLADWWKKFNQNVCSSTLFGFHNFRFALKNAFERFSLSQYATNRLNEENFCSKWMMMMIYMMEFRRRIKMDSLSWEFFGWALLEGK
jgi:hypothetical protein